MGHVHDAFAQTLVGLILHPAVLGHGHPPYSNKIPGNCRLSSAMLS